MSHAQETPSASERYLSASPAGVRQWLGNSAPTRERALMLHILAQPRGCRVDAKTIAAELGCPTAELAKTLFSLNRMGSVLVSTAEPPPQARSAWDSLAQHLAALARHAGGPVVLADAQGLCVASSGAGEPVLQQLAAEPGARGAGTSAALHPDDTLGAFVLSSQAPLDPDDPAWVSLAQSLVTLLRRECSHHPAHPRP